MPRVWDRLRALRSWHLLRAAGIPFVVDRLVPDRVAAIDGILSGTMAVHPGRWTRGIRQRG